MGELTRDELLLRTFERARNGAFWKDHLAEFYGKLFHEGHVFEPVLRNSTDNQAVCIVCEAILDLLALHIQVLIAASLVQFYADLEPSGFGNQTIVDRQPVGILQVGYGYTDVPATTGLVQRCVLVWFTLLTVVKGRFPYIDLNRIPDLRPGAA